MTSPTTFPTGNAAVYVDAPVWPYRGMMMCHLMAMPEDLDALHAMAEKLGVRRWFQTKGQMPHYDICKSKRALAIKLGAQEVTRRETVAIMDAWREQRKLALHPSTQPPQAGGSGMETVPTGPGHNGEER